MNILELTATFGKLEGAKLQLRPGLSVITAPNEWGTSTWCAFVTAMLYGVDTRERSGKDSLAVKEKYAPWSGRPMEGRMVLEHGGRRITLERRTKRTPLGEFRAYETDSGLEIPGMTAENCGEMLLGVEKSVFCRSAFVKFSDLPVEADENLRRRLNALVTTGDESGSGEKLGKKLGELRRKIRYNKTGRIPDTQAELQNLRQQLQQLQALQDRQARLESDAARGSEQLRALELHRQMCAYERSRAARQRLEQAAQEAKDARADYDELDRTCREAPSRTELTEKLREGYALQEQLHTSVEIPVGSAAPGYLLWGLAVLAALGGAALCVAGKLIPGILAVMAGLVIGLAGAVLMGRRKHAQAQLQQEIRRRADRREELEQTLRHWQSQLAAREALDQARVRAEQTKQRLQDLLAVTRPMPRPQGEDRLTLSEEETDRQIGRLNESLRSWQLQAAQLRGQAEHLPRMETLQQQIEAARIRLQELERYDHALAYGQAALETAQQELQRRFVPRITRRAEEFLSRLTGGRYSRLSIGEDLSLQTAREDEATLRPGLWRSDGTADQMYLALRLAVWETLCPQAPLILDDALIRFDDRRLGYAMELLRELGETRQILLFTCQEREQTFLES